MYDNDRVNDIYDYMIQIIIRYVLGDNSLHRERQG